jgi:phosphoglycerate dehydrogenase-like enzyme
MGDRPIPLTNGSGAHGPAIGEYVVGVLMAHLKGFLTMHAAQQRSEWLVDFKLRELRGQRVGIVGLGDLGGSIARALEPFGVHRRALLNRTGR